MSNAIDAAACADLEAALEGVMGEVRLAVQDWRPMLARVNAIVDELENQSAAVAGRRTRRSDPVPAMARSPTTSPSWACATTRSTGQCASNRSSSPVSASCARASCACLRRGNELLEITPEIMAFLNEPRPLDHRQGEYPSRMCTDAVYLDYIGVKTLRRRR